MAWINPRTGKEISAAYERRLERNGISQSSYESGGANLSAARGHPNEREERFRRERGIYNDRFIKEARQRGLLERFPHFTEYNRERQKDLSRAFLNAFSRKEFAEKNPRSVLGKKNPDAFRTYAQLANAMREPPSEPRPQRGEFSSAGEYREALAEYDMDYGGEGEWELLDYDDMDWEEARADYKETMGAS